MKKRKKSQQGLPWHKKISLRCALVVTTVLCVLGGISFALLGSYSMAVARDALYYQYITPYFADQDASGEYYVVSDDGKTLYVHSSLPYAYVDPDTGEIYPLETTESHRFSPQGRCVFSTAM